MRILMAPMRGFTDKIYRHCWSRHFKGVDAAMAPFVATQQITAVSPKLLRDLVPSDNRQMPVIPQALGNNAPAFLTLAERLKEMGYTELNLNMGCPYQKVAKKKKGSGMLLHPEMVDAFFAEVMGSCPMDVSVKIRLGRKDAAESKAIVAVLNRYDLKEVTVHPRLGEQMYDGRPDLARFCEVLESLRHPVVYNGDIWTAEDCRAVRAAFPSIDSWMIGRGLLADPFLAESMRGEAPGEDRTERFMAFHAELWDTYETALFGPSHLLARMKGWWDCFRLSFEGGDRVFKKVRKMSDPALFRREVEGFMNEAVWKTPDLSGWVEMAACDDRNTNLGK